MIVATVSVRTERTGAEWTERTGTEGTEGTGLQEKRSNREEQHSYFVTPLLCSSCKPVLSLASVPVLSVTSLI